MTLAVECDQWQANNVQRPGGNRFGLSQGRFQNAIFIANQGCFSVEMNKPQAVMINRVEYRQKNGPALMSQFLLQLAGVYFTVVA